ncbi:hypothetical protein DSM07_04850 [Oenococcus sp. UCMA 16435]|nr:hypothetical protein DSM07_04850 [Oenococcus sp. UCMA 16435]MDI4583872.1 hypothetical protein [Oenococcus sp. UCMA 14587]
MKRVTSACLLIALIFASFLVINVYETKDNIRVKNLGKTDHSFQFYITNTNKSASSELTFFKQLANKEHISIFRTDTQGKKLTLSSNQSSSIKAVSLLNSSI